MGGKSKIQVIECIQKCTKIHYLKIITMNDLQYSCLGNSTEGEAWQATAPWECKESDMT